MKKVIVITLDGFGWTLFREWLKTDKSESMKKVIAEGVKAKMLSTVPPFTHFISPAIYTGKNAKKLGILAEPIMNWSSILSRIKTERLWERLSIYGYKSCIFGIPVTYPPERDFDGVMVCGEDTFPGADGITFPPDIGVEKYVDEKLMEKNGRMMGIKKPVKQKRRIIAQYKKALEKKVQALIELDEKMSFDFLFFWIYETDYVQHLLWEKKDDIFSFFEEVFILIKKIRQKYPAAHLLIISDHGFHEEPAYYLHLNNWLWKEGYLKIDTKSMGDRFILWSYLITNRLPWNMDIFRIIGRSIYNLLKGSVGKMEKSAYPDKAGAPVMTLDDSGRIPFRNSESTVAYASTYWGITVLKQNLKEDYHEFCSKLIGKLKRFRLKKDAPPVFDRVYHKDELFPGHGENDKLPDIIFLPADKKYLPSAQLSTSLITPRYGRMKGRGSHHTDIESVFMASGPGIKKNVHLNQISIYDIMPTILHLFNVPLPPDIDGRVLKEIFDPGSSFYKREDKHEKISEKVWIEKRISFLRKTGKI